MKNIKFNINDFVKVKLTPLGKNILRNQFLESIVKKSEYYQYDEPVEDSNGYCRFQFHELMATFGGKFFCFNSIPFATEIIFEVKTEDE